MNTALDRNDADQRLFEGVTLKRYCEIVGETRPAVRSRISRGDWIEGVHYWKDEYDHIWIIPRGVNQWMKAGSKTA